MYLEGKGQNFLNKLFGATPENPLILPVKAPEVEAKVEVSEGTKKAIYYAVGGLALAGITIALIITRNKKKKS